MTAVRELLTEATYLGLFPRERLEYLKERLTTPEVTHKHHGGITPEEQARLLEVSDAQPGLKGLRDYALFHLWLDTGLRRAVPLPLKLRVAFTHARKVRVVEMALGWLKVRLPKTQQVLWVLVAHDPDLDRDLVLITNVPIHTAHDAETAYTEWRYRPQIEHTYRFDQEDGLDVEDVRVQTLERMRRIFVMVLLAALFVYHIAHAWPQQMVLWLRRLGGKLGLSSDRDGPYILLAGIRAVFVTVATLAFAAQHPFPRAGETCG